MNCKNCGTRVRDTAKVCPNCGAFLDDESGYTLLTADDKYDDVYSTDLKRHGAKKGWRFFIVILLIVALTGSGAYYYFTKVHPVRTAKPELTFTAGSGIINEDEEIIYILIDKGSNIEYIHGVDLLAGEGSSFSKEEVLTEQYEYTKNVDSSFRAIFFDADQLPFDITEEATYTFRMTFSFIGSDQFYTYDYPITLSGIVSEDVSDTIFDHSMYQASDGTGETTVQEETSASAEDGSVSLNYLYNGYWYTKPMTEGDNLSIDAYKFAQDETYTVTHYTKAGTANWKAATESGSIVIEDGYLTVAASDGTIYYSVDAENEKLIDKSGYELSKKVYNSITNAEDSF